MRRRRRKKQRKLIIVSIVSLLFVMSIGYAAFNTNINITAKGNILEKSRIIRSWDGNSVEDFHSNYYKTNIVTATFLDTREVPDEAVESWDVSETKDGGVMAYVTGGTSQTGKFDLYIGADKGVIANEDSSYLFQGFINTTSIDFNNNFDTSNTTNMYAMFRMRISSGVYQSNLTLLNLSGFDTSKVTNMAEMFAHNFYLTNIKGLEKFDTSNVTDMGGMFYNGQSFTELDLSNFNTSKVTNMQGMFGECTKLIKLNLCSFDTSKVTNMYNMFGRTSKLEKVLVGPSWTMVNVTNLSKMWENSKISSVTTGQC